MMPREISIARNSPLLKAAVYCYLDMMLEQACAAHIRKGWPLPEVVYRLGRELYFPVVLPVIEAIKGGRDG
jgi:hypothetical protein